MINATKELGRIKKLQDEQEEKFCDLFEKELKQQLQDFRDKTGIKIIFIACMGSCCFHDEKDGQYHDHDNEATYRPYNEFNCDCLEFEDNPCDYCKHSIKLTPHLEELKQIVDNAFLIIREFEAVFNSSFYFDIL